MNLMSEIDLGWRGSRDGLLGPVAHGRILHRPFV